MTDVEREFGVDGETFLVRLHEDGGFDCTWLTGRNSGYGFGSGAPKGYAVRSEGVALPSSAVLPHGLATDERVTASIREFLTMIDPSTGFIGG